jgi:hypothetical protein
VIGENPQWEDGMRLVTLVRGITITFLSLCPISVGHGQSPAEFYKGKNVNIYILSLFVSALDDHILLYTLLAFGRPSRPRAFISAGIQMLRVDTGMRR